MNSDLLAVRLFGSQARGEGDSGSDVDVLAVVRQSNETVRNEVVELVRKRLSAFSDKYISVSVYGIERIAQHYISGSLFAWHLYRESISLTKETGFPDDISMLGVPATYVAARSDMSELGLMINGVIESLSEASCSLVFEAGLLYLAIRNSAIVASEAAIGEMRFGRYAAFDVSRGAGIALSIKRECFDVLAQCRSRSVHGLPAPLVKREALCRVAMGAKDWIAQLQELVNDRAT